MANIFTRVQSRESYPVPDRPHYIIHLGKGTADFYMHGKEMGDEECGNVIIQLVNALNAAENQIDMLHTMIQNLDYRIDPSESSDYLDEYPEEEDYKSKYKIENLKDALFHSMMKKDDKAVSRYINQITVLESKQGVKHG